MVGALTSVGTGLAVGAGEQAVPPALSTPPLGPGFDASPTRQALKGSCSSSSSAQVSSWGSHGARPPWASSCWATGQCHVTVCPHVALGDRAQCHVTVQPQAASPLIVHGGNCLHRAVSFWFRLTAAGPILSYRGLLKVAAILSAPPPQAQARDRGASTSLLLSAQIRMATMFSVIWGLLVQRRRASGISSAERTSPGARIQRITDPARVVGVVLLILLNPGLLSRLPPPEHGLPGPLHAGRPGTVPRNGPSPYS